MTDRVRRPKEFEKFMFVLRDHKDHKVFETYKDCLIFCAALCARRGKSYKEAFRDSAEPIMLHIFSGEYDKAFINALAIADSGDAMIIDPDREDERVRILEEYACGGLRILESELSNIAISKEKQIVSMLTKETSSATILDDITNFNTNL